MPEPFHATPTAGRRRTLRSGRSRWPRWVVAAVVVAILVLAGVIEATRTGGPSYRIASVERADVDTTLDSLGTIQPINEANLSFPVAGNVRSVSAAAGQHVTLGQTLAQLDTTSLDAQVASARSAVAAAQARLAADESSQTAGTSTTAVTPAAFTMEITRLSEPPSAARDLVTKQQVRLIADQRQADQDLATEQRDLKTETSLCKPLLTSIDGGKTRTSSNPDRRSLPSSVAPETAPQPAPKAESAVPQAPDVTVAPHPLDTNGCK
ncbi:MAG: biotin/lipoyl-binding protein, partial [Pseudonocardiales bacterium]|nr:biotin/lipoyl-binding protein [Pseudonocardiales bacterium]